MDGSADGLGQRQAGTRLTSPRSASSSRLPSRTQRPWSTVRAQFSWDARQRLPLAVPPIVACTAPPSLSSRGVSAWLAQRCAHFRVRREYSAACEPAALRVGNPLTLRDGRRLIFVAASGQILMTAHTQAEPVAERPLHPTEDGHYRGSEEGPRTKSGVGSRRQNAPIDQQLDLRSIDKWRQNSPTEPVWEPRQHTLGERSELPGHETFLGTDGLGLPSIKSLPESQNLRSSLRGSLRGSAKPERSGDDMGRSPSAGIRNVVFNRGN